MAVQTVTDQSGLDALSAEWQHLFERRGTTPFNDPRLIIAWWHTRGSNQGRRLHIVTVRINDKLVAVAPLSVMCRSGVKFLRWAGDEVYDYCDTLLDDVALAPALWRAVARGGGFDVALIKNVPPCSITHSELQEFGRPVRRKKVARLRIQWSSSTEWQRAALSGKSLKRFRYLERRLAERDPLEFEILAEPGDPRLGSAVKTLVQQKSAWVASRGKSDGLFVDPQAGAALLHDIVRRAAQSGSLHLSWLRCGSSVLAIHLGFAFGRTFYYYIPSYSCEWSAFSPGKLLMYRLIGWAVNNGFECFDFMSGEADYKSVFANEQCELSDFTFVGSLRGRILEPALVHGYFRLSQAMNKSADRPK